MKRTEFEQLMAVIKKWITENDADIEKYRRTKLPIRVAKLSGAIEAQQKCTEELLDVLKRTEVQNG